MFAVNTKESQKMKQTKSESHISKKTKELDLDLPPVLHVKNSFSTPRDTKPELIQRTNSKEETLEKDVMSFQNISLDDLVKRIEDVEITNKEEDEIEFKKRKIFPKDDTKGVGAPLKNEVISKKFRTFGRNVGPNDRYKSFKFSKEIMNEIRPYLESDNINGLLEICEDWFFIILSIVISYKFNQFCLSTTTPNFSFVFLIYIIIDIGLYLLSILIVGARMRSLADVLHQSSHYSLAKNRKWNYVLGTVFSGYPVFQSWSVYRQSHVRMHHIWFGNPYKDPDYLGYIDNKLCGDNRNSENTKKYLSKIISLKNSWSYVKYLLKNKIWNKIENKNERIVRIFYYSLFCILFYKFPVLFKIFLSYWMVAFFTTNVYIGSFLELIEHYPMCDGTKPYCDLYITRNRIGGWFTNFFLGIHDEGYHLLHHLFAKIPSWNYKKVHSVLLKCEEYKKLDHGESGWRDMIDYMIKESDAPDVDE